MDKTIIKLNRLHTQAADLVVILAKRASDRRRTKQSRERCEKLHAKALNRFVRIDTQYYRALAEWNKANGN